MRIGYIRVSTAKQAQTGTSLNEQEKAVRDAGAETTYTDAGWSGKNIDRPGLDAMQKALHDGDTVIVSALDRLGRSTADIAQMLHDWQQRNITLIAVRDGIDTSTPTGTMMAQIMAVVAEMERSFILERTAAGRAAAKASGKIANRPRKWNLKKARQVAHLKADGWSISEIARTLNVSRDTIRRMIAEAEAEA
jgi:DNA invertase Pin-like site-specific DNA recombinase